MKRRRINEKEDEKKEEPIKERGGNKGDKGRIRNRRRKEVGKEEKEGVSFQSNLSGSLAFRICFSVHSTPAL